ncbi:LamG domain-containing protein [Candidatus Woesearchaeota archaeon]|nr:LamG domain-containing protein [Candidatus Woesearchaeota archaeon]
MRTRDVILILLALAFLSITVIADPSIDSVYVNTTNGNNVGDENLTTNTVNAQNIGNGKVIFNWLLNGTSFPVLYMPFDGNTTGIENKIRDYAYGHNGSYNFSGLGSPDYLPTGGNDSRGAFDFEFSETDKILINHSSLYDIQANEDIVVAFWMKPESFSNGYAIGKFGVGGDYFVRPNSGNVQVWISGDDASGGSYSLTSSFGTGIWYHVVVNWERARSNLTLWVNGRFNSSATTTTTGAINNNVNLTIGGYHGSANTFDGVLDEFYFFKKSLSSNQIYALYNNSNQITAEQTNIGDTWSFCATPSNNTFDGTTVCSSNFTINVTSMNGPPITPEFSDYAMILIVLVTVAGFFFMKDRT